MVLVAALVLLTAVMGVEANPQSARSRLDARHKASAMYDILKKQV